MTKRLILAAGILAYAFTGTTGASQAQLSLAPDSLHTPPLHTVEGQVFRCQALSIGPAAQAVRIQIRNGTEVVSDSGNVVLAPGTTTVHQVIVDEWPFAGPASQYYCKFTVAGSAGTIRANASLAYHSAALGQPGEDVVTIAAS